VSSCVPFLPPQLIIHRQFVASTGVDARPSYLGLGTRSQAPVLVGDSFACVSGPADSSHSSEQGDNFTPRAPDGEPLTHGRRMTYRDARSWVKRGNVLLGRWPCGQTIEWVPEQERKAFVARARQAEGKDCNVVGDVVLYRLADGRPAVVIEEPC
jgi:hypothetical protein